MDTDNDNEQLNQLTPNSSGSGVGSRNSSSNSSSSNLLTNLPMLPMIQQQSFDNDNVDGGGNIEDPPPPPPLEPPQQQSLEQAMHVDGDRSSVVAVGPPFQSQSASAAQSMSDNSVFVTPLLFNNNTTPPPSSPSPSSSSSSISPSPTSSTHHLQFYHNNQRQQPQQQQQTHSLHALHFEHSPSPPSLQQHVQQQPPTPPSSAQQQTGQELQNEGSTAERGENQLQPQQQGAIGDTVDESALDPLVNELHADIATTSQPQQQQGCQRDPPQPTTQQQQPEPESAQASAQRCIESEGLGAAGSNRASSERNRTPPTALPLLLQQEEHVDADDVDADADTEAEPVDELTASGGSARVRVPKSSAERHFTHYSPFTHHPSHHPNQDQAHDQQGHHDHHHHHHHQHQHPNQYYPNFGGYRSSASSNANNNSPFAFDIPAYSGGNGGNGSGNGNNNNGGNTSISGGVVNDGANTTTTNILLTANMLGSGSSSGSGSGNPSGSGGLGIGGAAIAPAMPAGPSGVGGSSHHHHHHHHHSHQHQHMTDRLKMLYPNVNEAETPLPRCWSPHDKCLSIGLSQNNLRVHYKGIGNKHNDAASVRTAHPIPPACGLYYFEVKIISKGKNGYMGIGLTAQQFRMNRLPGWDKQSYGYHGDDGNSFSSSGNGQSYGPTFTTGDIIGCCVNFVDNTCFYTKNGIDLGIAFRDLPSKLYPTVGLQTPGEEVDANFGQEPFKFDQIEDMMKQMRAQMKTTIYDFPMTPDQGDPTTLLHKMVSSYLLHNGYSQTAEAFARSTGQTFEEDISSIRNRQKILKLVLSGKMGQAIDLTIRSYPGLLENNKNLWFMLKCRQFVEMVNGADIEYCPTTNYKLTNSITKQTQTSPPPLPPPNQTSVIQSTKSYQNGDSNNSTAAAAATTATSSNNNAQTTITTTAAATTQTNSTVINTDNHAHQEDMKNATISDEHCCDDAIAISNKNNNANIDYMNDVEMETTNLHTNGDACKNGNTDFNNSMDADEEMDVDIPSTQKYSHGIERILEFGKELSQMGQQLEKENQMNDDDRQMLEDAFSLIAYSNPWASPLGWQLCPTKRENVCTALNSAILESMNYPRRPPLDICVAHASELLKVMAHASLGACAFVNIEDVFPQN